MPRYPALVHNKSRIDLSSLGAALAGRTGGLIKPDAIDKNIPDSAEGETAEMEADKTGVTNDYKPGYGGNSLIQPKGYPKYNQPGFLRRWLDPSGARQVDDMNFKSSMQEVEDQAASERIDQTFNNQKALAEHKFKMEGALNKMINDGQMTSEQAKTLQNHYNNIQLDKSEFESLKTKQDLARMQDEPEVYDANARAILATPGSENRYRDANTATSTAKLRFIPREEEANIGATLEGTRASKQRTDQLIEEQPYNVERAKNLGLQSGMIRIPGGEVVGNPLSSVNGAPVNYFGVTPEIKQDPGGLSIQPDVNDPSKMVPQFRPPMAARPPSLAPLGTLNRLALPSNSGNTNTISTPSITPTHSDDTFDYGIDPTTGMKVKRLRNKVN